SLTRGNGVVTGYQYDAVSRLAQLGLDFPGTADDLTLGFAYNPAGQIVSSTRSNDLYAWTGHGSGSTSTTANGLNQIAGWVSTLGHDSKGNIISDGSYTYAYSSENLLTSLANPSGAVQTSSTYAYDPLMRLSNIDSSNAGLDAQLGYDGQEIVFEGLSDGRTRRYVFGPGTDEPLVAYLTNGSGTSRLWYQADERGSNIRLSGDSGAAGGVGRYDEYGVGTGVSRFHYTGQYWLADANLHYYRARIYDPRLGRFLQPDPIGYGSGMNLYAYVGGDPVNFTDPLGLRWVRVCVGEEGNLKCGTQWVEDDPGSGGAGGAALLGAFRRRGSGDTPAELLPGAFADSPHAAICGNEDCSEAIVTAPTKKKPFYFNGRKWVSNPHWVKPWYSDYVDYGTGFFFAGPMLVIAGVEVGTPIVIGAEIKIASKMRLAPWGNRTGHRYGKWPHYHRKGVGPGQGKSRHRPWESKSPDTSFWDRF
ncbi:MAG TPA: RHS repeat-associated core domain-containing protein, partial [Allosphingosinicella sp.]